MDDLFQIMTGSLRPAGRPSADDAVVTLSPQFLSMFKALGAMPGGAMPGDPVADVSVGEKPEDDAPQGWSGVFGGAIPEVAALLASPGQAPPRGQDSAFLPQKSGGLPSLAGPSLDERVFPGDPPSGRGTLERTHQKAADVSQIVGPVALVGAVIGVPTLVGPTVAEATVGPAPDRIDLPDQHPAPAGGTSKPALVRIDEAAGSVRLPQIAMADVSPAPRHAEPVASAPSPFISLTPGVPQDGSSVPADGTPGRPLETPLTPAAWPDAWLRRQPEPQLFGPEATGSSATSVSARGPEAAVAVVTGIAALPIEKPIERYVVGARAPETMRRLRQTGETTAFPAVAAATLVRGIVAGPSRPEVKQKPAEVDVQPAQRATAMSPAVVGAAVSEGPPPPWGPTYAGRAVPGAVVPQAAPVLIGPTPLAAAAGPIAAANPQMPDVSAAVASQTSQVDLLRDEPMPMATEAASVLAAPGVADLRAAVGMQSVAPPGPPASTTALAEAISRQMAQGVVDRPEAEGLVEIALDPPELGRVRLSFSDVGGALTLAITAERPETAELMRRHLSLLVEQFQKAGLDAPNVDINDRDGGNARERGSAQTRVDVATPAQIEDRAGVVRPTAFGRASDGLDLRL